MDRLSKTVCTHHVLCSLYRLQSTTRIPTLGTPDSQDDNDVLLVSTADARQHWNPRVFIR